MQRDAKGLRAQQHEQRASPRCQSYNTRAGYIVPYRTAGCATTHTTQRGVGEGWGQGGGLPPYAMLTRLWASRIVDVSDALDHTDAIMGGARACVRVGVVG